MIPFSGSSGPPQLTPIAAQSGVISFLTASNMFAMVSSFPVVSKRIFPSTVRPPPRTTAHFVPPMSIPMYFFVLIIFPVFIHSIDSSSFVSFCLTLSSFFATTDA